MLYRTIVTIIVLAFAAGCTTDTTKTETGERSSSQASNTLSKNLQYANSRADSSLGQTIYVPVYSHIYQQNQQKTFNLTATLSIRNADLETSLTLISVTYYDSKGNKVKHFLNDSLTVRPLASTSFVIEEDELRGGVGANFILRWQSRTPLFPPVVEAVMISTSQQQGISFVSEGRVIEENSP